MDPSSNSAEIELDCSPLFRIFKGGVVERLRGTETVTPSDVPQNGVVSKDVVISPETGLSARLYLPVTAAASVEHRKLPLLLYIHGGGFCIESPFSPVYHSHLVSVVSTADVVAVSVHYRRCPESPIPIPYDDSWEAFLWATSHSTGGGGPEPWLNRHADFARVFFAGDSAGANIAHDMAIRAGTAGAGSTAQLSGVKISGIVLVHPYFGENKEAAGAAAAGERLWNSICPSEVHRPLFYLEETKMSELRCGKVLIFVAEKDFLRGRGWSYYEILKKSGWGGDVEIVETEGEEHVFHLFHPGSAKAAALVHKFASFMNS